MIRTAALLATAPTCSLANSALLGIDREASVDADLARDRLVDRAQGDHVAQEDVGEPAWFLRADEAHLVEELGRISVGRVALVNLAILGSHRRGRHPEGRDGARGLNGLGLWLRLGESAFTLPGHTVGTQLFFDRTPASWDELDQVLKARPSSSPSASRRPR